MKRTIIEPNTKIGYWTVGDFIHKGDRGFYHCTCQCGKERDLLPYLLTSGKTLSCGCMAKLGKGADMTGEKKGNLYIEQKVVVGNRSFYKCRCVCGKEKLIATNHINLVSSCGCKPNLGNTIRESLQIYCKNGTYVPGLTRTNLNKNNTSGYKGVSYRKDRNKYRAYIKFQRRNIHLGYYNSFEDAVEARKIAEMAILKEVEEENYERAENM